jgi:hypothetical protein
MKHSQDVTILTRQTVESRTVLEDEVLVEDSRAALSPVEEVEQKLLQALRSSAALMSQLQQVYRPRPR